MRPLERRLAEVFNWSGLYQFEQSGLALWLLIASFFGRANVQTLAQIVEQPTIQVADQLVRMWRKVFEII